VATGTDGSWSLGRAAPSQLPWPYRGATRAREYELVRVGDRTLTVSEAIACLDHVWADERLLRRLIDACIVSSAIERLDLQLAPRELQRATDALRRGKGLYTAAQMRNWLAAHGMTINGFADLARTTELLARLRDRVVGDRTDEEFAERAADFARHDIAEVDPGADPTLFAADPAGTVVARCTAGRRARVASWLGGELPEHLRGLREADVGTVVATNTGYAMTLARHPAALDQPTRARVAAQLFDEWLAEQRAGLDIEWFWGSEAAQQ
jgi:putative peptide maturation system protein